MEILHRAELIIIFLELFVLIWYSIITTIKSSKKNRPQQFFFGKMLIILCGLIALLYGIDFFYDPSFIKIIVSLLWIACVFVWRTSYKKLPKTHAQQDEVAKLKQELTDMLLAENIAKDELEQLQKEFRNKSQN